MKGISKIAHTAIYNYAVLNEEATRAYIHAQTTHNPNWKAPRNVRQKAFKMLHSMGATKEIARLISQKAEKDGINRQRQTEKLESLRLKAENEHDLATTLGCIREENKIYGLVIDVQATGDDVLQQVNEEAKKIADKIPDTYLLADKPAQ